MDESLIKYLNLVWPAQHAHSVYTQNIEILIVDRSEFYQTSNILYKLPPTFHKPHSSSQTPKNVYLHTNTV